MVVVQVVLLFRSETWVLTPRLEKSIKGFCHRAARRMAGMGPKHQQDGTWLYPPIGVTLEIVVLEDNGVYIACRQNTVMQYIATHHIMNLCLEAERKPGICLSRLW